MEDERNCQEMFIWDKERAPVFGRTEAFLLVASACLRCPNARGLALAFRQA